MATTDINGMVFYANPDPVTSLNANLNAISTAVTNAFNSETRTFRVANQAARDALLTARGASLASPLQVDRADTGNIERNTTGLSSGWSIISGNGSWTALALQNSFGGWGQGPAVRKWMGRWWYRGTLSYPVSTPTSATVFAPAGSVTMPSGYPTGSLRLLAPSETSVCIITPNLDGSISCAARASGQTIISLEGLSHEA